jgi:hypothetical protein
MPVCSSLFCPPGVSLLLMTSICTNLKWCNTPDQEKWGEKKIEYFEWLYFTLADQCVGNINEGRGTRGIHVTHIS